jgi:non-reducing end alpha-L-arabinofuranosidase
MNRKNNFIVILLLALISPIAMMMLIAMSWQAGNFILPRPEGPCDIYSAAGYPCVAAHSSTRALYASYSGPLYQVVRQSDGKTLDIGVVQPGNNDPGGYADAAAQDSFCANTVCWITKIYDQSGKGNDLLQAPPGTFKGPAKGGFNNLPIADMAPITINGHKAYGVYIMPGMGLRNNNAANIAINDEPEGIYYVIDGKHFDSGCCFDYGNSSTNSRAVGTGTMETTYYGTATAWGSGNGPGPWIMSDMEAGLFSGYSAKKNDVPTVDSLRFITAIVNGGGGNKWELRGGNAQKGGLTTFYSGVRPETPSSNNYYPMNKKGGILLGIGGDNGNGSAGTFFEGVMTTGYPAETTTDAVQANIVAAKYDVQRVNLSRITTFTPKSTQDVTETFINTTGVPVEDIKLSVVVPNGWKAIVSGSTNTSKIFTGLILPGASVSATFTISSSVTTGAGFITGKVDWKNQKTGSMQFETTSSQRVRNVLPVKINEIRFSTGDNQTNQFIELYNASSNSVDISNWILINTRSEWAPVKLGTIPNLTKLAAHGFYLLGLSTSGLVAPASREEKIINVRNSTGFEVGQKITIDGEVRTIAKVGTPASPMTTLFVPVSTGPWLTIPAGSTNLPVTDATGFAIGQKIGIDIGGTYEVATVTQAGKAATQTNLSIAAKSGEVIIKVAANSNMTIGDTLTIDTGARIELVRIKRIINVVAAPSRLNFDQGGSSRVPGEVELEVPLKLDHMSGVDVSDAGTGISFFPATHFVHKSGDAVQALGSGITLERALDKHHEFGAAVLNRHITSAGYQGTVVPNQWYGDPLSDNAGSVALMDKNNKVVVDAIVYGSQQSSSSANGTITSPDIAVLEGDQSQGGCIVVSPASGRGFFPFSSTVTKVNKSVGRYPDGDDSDNNCHDFLLQNTTTLSAATVVGSDNIKAASVAAFTPGQKIIIGSGMNYETAVIKTIGTAGGTSVNSATNAGTTIIPVPDVEGFGVGQSITIDDGANSETAVIASINVGRFRFDNPNIIPVDTIKVTVPLSKAHSVGVQVSGSGITLAAPLSKVHSKGEQVTDNIPTPGVPNRYSIKNNR